MISGNVISYRPGSLRVLGVIGEKSTGSATVRRSQAEPFAEKEPVIVSKDAGGRLFKGVINQVTVSPIRGTTDCDFKLKFEDNVHKAEKKIVYGVWTNEYPGDIVQDILDTFLASEGVAAGTIQQGSTRLERVVLPYVKASAALRELAKRAGFWWDIDCNDLLQFVARSTLTATTPLTPSIVRKNSESLVLRSPKYRNRQYVRGARDRTDSIPYTLVGDGEQRAHLLPYDVYSIDSITRNGNPQTVGIRGVDSGKEWYYAKGVASVFQDLSETPIDGDAADTAVVTFVGEYPIVARADDLDAQATRKAIEGEGSGIVEEVLDDASQDSQDAALQRATQELELFSQISKRYTCTTETEFSPGYLVTVTSPGCNIDGVEYLIQSVAISEIGRGVHRKLLYTLECVIGREGENFREIFRADESSQNNLILVINGGTDSILVTTTPFAKTWTDAEEAPKPFNLPKPEDILMPGAFSPAISGRETQYLAWLDASGNEIGRKAAVVTTATDTQLFSRFFLSATDAVTTIYGYRWHIGNQATATPNSGYVLATETLDSPVTKTQYEAFVIERTDTKGF